MPEERTLVANLVPRVLDEDMRQFMEQISKDMSSTITVDLKGGDSTSTSSVQGDPAVTEAVKQQSEIAEKSQEALNDMSKSIDELSTTSKRKEDKDNENKVEAKNQLSSLFSGMRDHMSGGFNKASGTMAKAAGGVMIAVGVVLLIFDLLKKAWDLLLSSSPFLRNIMQMFSGMLEMILGPLGTAIGMELIPILKKTYERIMEGVRSIWKAYEEGGLSAMIKETFNVLWDVFAPFIPEILSIGIFIVGELLHGLVDFVFGEGTWDTIVQFTKDCIAILNGIVDFVSGFTDPLGDALGGIADALGGLFGGGSSGSGGGGSSGSGGKGSSGGSSLGMGDPNSGRMSSMLYYAGVTGLEGQNNIYREMSKADESAIYSAYDSGGYDGVKDYLNSRGWSQYTTGGVTGSNMSYSTPKSASTSYTRGKGIGDAGNVYNITVNGYTDTDLSTKIVNAIDTRTDVSRIVSGF